MIKVSLIVLAGLALARVLRRRPAAIRHWALMTAILCAAAAPVLEWMLPSWGAGRAPVQQVAIVESSIALPGTAAGSSSVDAPRQLEAATRSQGIPFIIGALPTLWMLGVALTTCGVLLGLARLRWLAVHSVPLESGPWVERAAELAARIGVRRPVRLLITPHATLLVTWGFWRPRIALPAGAREWTDARIRIVLAHELAHIKRGDWLVHITAELLRCLYWFNPLVWIARRRIRDESEEACDDEVLGLGVDAPEYAGHLLDLVRELKGSRQRAWSGLAAPAMARPGSLERRVRAMLTSGPNRTPASAPARFVIVCVLVAISAVVAAYGAGAQSFATVSGTVVDPNNSAVPGVTVSLSDAQSGSRHEVRTDDAGRFEILGVRPGQYQLQARFMGFRTLNDSLAVTTDVRRDLRLQVGTLSESVTITRSFGTPQPSTARAPQVAASPSRPCQPSAAGGAIRPPMKIRDVYPVYPANADDSVQGVVVLEGKIGTDGTVLDTKVVRTPHPELTRAAVEAFEQWLFTPTLLNCVPIEVGMTATMHFSVAK